ncbi:MAG: hypothetical protein LBJ46_06240 [Planctomycetota bacterium]|nr:hypothetical protein [Planctomycetota bacterium]
MAIPQIKQRIKIKGRGLIASSRRILAWLVIVGPLRLDENITPRPTAIRQIGSGNLR